VLDAVRMAAQGGAGTSRPGAWQVWEHAVQGSASGRRAQGGSAAVRSDGQPLGRGS
jgi:hypothetical protein